MCGLFGFQCKKEYDERIDVAVPIMALIMEDRGAHSWGISDGTDILKDTGAISNGLTVPNFQGKLQLLGHTRFATQGTKSKENSHPWKFESNGKQLIGAHNGQISNHWELNRTFARDFEVDSQHIFQHIVEDKPLKDLEGYGAIVYFYNGKLYLGRFNGGQLAIIRTPLGVFFASTYRALSSAASMANIPVDCEYRVDDNKLYSIENGQLYNTDIKLDMTETFYNAQGTGYLGGGGNWWDQKDNKKGKNPSLPFGEKRNKNNVGSDNTKAKTKKSISGEVCAWCQAVFTAASDAWDTPEGLLCEECAGLCFKVDNIDSTVSEYPRHVSATSISNNVIEEIMDMDATDADDPFKRLTVRELVTNKEELLTQVEKELCITSCDECHTTLRGDDNLYVDQEEAVQWVLCTTCHDRLTDFAVMEAQD